MSEKYMHNIHVYYQYSTVTIVNSGHCIKGSPSIHQPPYKVLKESPLYSMQPLQRRQASRSMLFSDFTQNLVAHLKLYMYMPYNIHAHCTRYFLWYESYDIHVQVICTHYLFIIHISSIVVYWYQCKG